MDIFNLILWIAMVALPIAMAAVFWELVVGPLAWMAKSLPSQARAQKQLAAKATTSALMVRPAKPERALLDTMANAKRSWLSRDHEGVMDGFRVLVRTQPRVVNARGEAERFPWTRRDRKETRRVVGTTAVVDGRGRFRADIDLSITLPEEIGTFGPEPLIVGLLDGAFLAHARAAGVLQLSVSDGLVSVDSPFAAERGASDRVVQAALHVAVRLARSSPGPLAPVDLQALLLEVLRPSEPAVIRSRVVDQLLALPDLKDREDIESFALNDRSAQVRFAAARRAERDCFDVVAAIARSPTAPPGLAERALRHLVRRYPEARTLSVLEQLVEHGTPNTQRIAIRRLGELRHAPAAAWLDAVADATPVEVAVELAAALAQIGEPAGEAVLARMLARDEDEVRIAACDGLGSIGARGAVAALLELRDSRRSSRDVSLSAASAITQIQSRLGPRRGGALSVMELDPDAGAVSFEASDREPKDDDARAQRLGLNDGL